MSINDKLSAEAAAVGLVLVGAGKDCFYRTYLRTSCGHKFEYTISGVRNGEVRCRQCLDAKLHAEAAAVGLVLLGAGKDRHYRAYRWVECGHEAEYYTSAVRNGEVRCRQCLDDKLSAEAAAVGLVLLGAGKSYNYRTYRWIDCGHEAEYQATAVRNGRPRCLQCFDSKLHTEAAASGLVLVDTGKDASYRAYRWVECGHEAEYRISAVRTGTVRCQQCEATHWSLPSNVYVLVLTDGPNAWVKVGSAKRTTTRIAQYGLPAGVEVQVVREVPTKTGKDAYRIEQEIKDRFAAYRLDAEQMRAWHKRDGGGATECYQVAALDQILAAVA
jgi:diphthamide synthase (EF-2-diphthine--ammonia ligase)